MIRGLPILGRVILALACFLVAVRAAEVRRPNIVMIISDDQTYRDFGFMGNKLVQTPHLDRLAAQSARFLNGYVPTSVCSPSLATLLTGLYPHQNGIHYNHPPPGNSAFNRMRSTAEYDQVRSRAFYLIRSVPTLPRVLSEAGYRTFQTGKFWEGHYRNAGFAEGMTVFKASPEPAHGNRKLKGGELVAHGNGDAGLNIGRDTMQPIYDFIDRCGAAQRFFVWYAPFLPHQPHDSPKRLYDLYTGKRGVPENYVPYYAACSQFDDTVGQLVDYVEKKGLAANTLFVFVVDNGWTPSLKRAKNRPEEFDHTEESKRSPFEDGLRTPILFRWDSHLKPSTQEALVSSIDIVPTILSAAGLKDKIPNLPGLDLVPAAAGKAQLDLNRPVFGEIYPGDASSLGHPSRDLAYRWVRQGDYKFIVPHAHNGEKPWGGFLEKPALFNVVADPQEQHDLSGDSAQTARMQKLRQSLDDWWTPGKDSLPLPPNTSTSRP